MTAVVAALASGDGIIAALWLGGQARVAGTALILSCAAVALAMAGYAAGRRARPGCCQPHPAMPPPAALPPGGPQAGLPATRQARRPTWLEDTLDQDADVRAWERELGDWPPPPPRRPGRPGDSPAHGADGQ
jgi:hypothetical protein